MKYNLKAAGLILTLGIIIISGACKEKEKVHFEEGAYKVGQKGPAGGWVFYDKGNYDEGWRYLEAAPVDQAVVAISEGWFSRDTGGAQWGCYNKTIPGAQGRTLGRGKYNTQAIIKESKNTAAWLCTVYRGGGKNDWFLPSINELKYMRQNLHKQGIGNFQNKGDYLSSSEMNPRYAFSYSFDIKLYPNARRTTSEKTYGNHVRAVRAF